MSLAITFILCISLGYLAYAIHEGHKKRKNIRSLYRELKVLGSSGPGTDYAIRTGKAPRTPEAMETIKKEMANQ